MSLSEQLYLVDGSGFIFRAYHALPPMTRPDGIMVNAVYGYTNMLMKVIEDAGEQNLAVIFDAGRKSFRNDIYPDYKAHRPPAPDDLVPQFGLIREATESFNVPCIEMPGFEADDIIASYAKAAKAKGQNVVIVSSDKDLMQLVGDNVRMLDPMKNKLIEHDQVVEKFGVGPDRVIDVQALMGDSSDNVPGVPGIGPKTASQLINEYGDLENLLANADQIKQNKRRENLIEHADLARISKELVTLKDDIDLPQDVETLKPGPIDYDVLLSFLEQQQFHSIVARFNKKGHTSSASNDSAPSGASKPRQVEAKYELIQDRVMLKKWINMAMEKGIVAIDTETTSLNARSAEIVGISLAIEDGIACYIPTGHVQEVEGQTNLFGEVEEGSTSSQAVLDQLDLETVLDDLKPMLNDASVLKIGHNIKYDLTVLKNYGATVAPVADTMLMSYMADGVKTKHNLTQLAKNYFDHDMVEYKDVVTDKSHTFANVSLEKALEYAAEDADYCYRLYAILQGKLIQSGTYHAYQTIEQPLCEVISAMENKGIKVDESVLNALSQDFMARTADLEKSIYEQAGEEFNIGSPKQLGEILFGKLGLEHGKKSKTGAYSTSMSVLEPLSYDHKIVADILQWRSLSKLTSTYTEALKTQINAQTKRVHTSFSMAVTSTGRLSSSDPNLQNIPIRTEEGRLIRNAFVPEEGNTLLALDYSQIELRLLAEMADIEQLKHAFQNDVDVHALTASQVFGMPLDQVDGDARRRAKAINFGLIYGMGAFGLAKQLGCSNSEAKSYIDAYFTQYAGIKSYMEDVKAFCHENGYVETLFGRKCYIPSIHIKAQRGFAERQAINAPIQGTAADIIKRAMIQVHHRIEADKLPVKMLLQVHDELLFEVPSDKADDMIAIIKPIMENAHNPARQIDVPLLVEAGQGQNWNQAH